MDPESLNLVQLRTELKNRGLSPSGLKGVLVKRFRAALAKDGKTNPLRKESKSRNKKLNKKMKMKTGIKGKI